MPRSPRKEDSELPPLAANVRSLRERQGWNQSDLAKKSGCHLTTVSRIENAKGSPVLDQVLAIAKALDTSIEVLLRDERPKEKTKDEIEADRLCDKIRSFKPELLPDVAWVVDGLVLGRRLTNLQFSDPPRLPPIADLPNTTDKDPTP